MKSPVSILIPALNEENEIAGCLKSLEWADEVIVVDSGSSDLTRDIAEGAGARIVQFRYEVGGPKKKNWALENIVFRNEWILIVDADERVPPALAKEIDLCVRSRPDEVGFFLNRRFFFMGRWIRHAGYYPSWNLRLLRQNAGRYENVIAVNTKSGDNEVHEHMIVNGPVGYLNAPMDHFAYRSIESFVSKHNRYSNWEAIIGNDATKKIDGSSAITRRLNIRRSLKRGGRSLPFPHWLRFVYHFVLKCGFLDGFPGYVMCHLIAEYEFQIWAKRREMTHYRESEPTKFRRCQP